MTLDLFLTYINIFIFWPLNFLFYGTLFIIIFVPIIASKYIQTEIIQFIPKYRVSIFLLNSFFFLRSIFINKISNIDTGYFDDSTFWFFFILIFTFILIIFFFSINRFVLYTNNILEFSFLFIFFHLGSIIVIKINNFGAIFIGLEIVTLVGYMIIISERKNRFSNFAGIQYFILGSFPSAILVIGFGLFYLQSGAAWFGDLELLFNSTVMGFSNINNLIMLEYTNETEKVSNIFLYNINSIDYSFIIIEHFFIYDSIINNTNFKIIFPLTAITFIATICLFFNFFFKIAAAPFHIWAPSVYRNSAIISVAFLSIFAKLIVFFLILKLTSSFIITYININFFIYIIVGFLSILTGIFIIFSEKNTKLFFIYSSIGHVGYILIGLGLNTIQGITGAMIYLLIYCISAFIRWFTLISIGREYSLINSFSILKKNNTELALAFAFLMFSMSGLPPFAGFFIKLDIRTAVMNLSIFNLLYLIFLTTVAVFFYYLRLIKIIFYDQTKIKTTMITNNTYFNQEYLYNNYINWIIIVIVLILAFYTIFINKRFIIILTEIILTWF